MKKAIISAIFVLLGIWMVEGRNRVRQTREEYIDRYHRIAVEHMERYGIPASITLAQGILESDCGNSHLSRSSNNHFGIKCKRDWQGERVYHDDDAKGECFRAYPTVEESYEDHAEFLDRSPRYDSLFVYAPDDYRSWARGLKAAGYATAPDYAERLVKIIEESHLYLFDREGGERLYASASDPEEHFLAASSVHTPASSEEGVDPDNYHVTINAHAGYNVYRTNGVSYIRAKSGDTFEQIGRTFRLSAHNLRRFNEVAKQEQPLAGEIIFLEQKRKAWQGTESLHTAVEGDTPYSVSQRYGIRQKSLKRMNHLKRHDEEFRAGSSVRIR